MVHALFCPEVTSHLNFAVVDLISFTKTESGLVVKARLDERKYKKDVKVPRSEIEKLNIKRHKFHGEWNYTIVPRSKSV